MRFFFNNLLPTRPHPAQRKISDKFFEKILSHVSNIANQKLEIETKKILLTLSQCDYLLIISRPHPAKRKISDFVEHVF